MLLSRDKALERERQNQVTMLNEKQREMERQKGIHEFTLKSFNDGLKTALDAALVRFEVLKITNVP